MKDKDDELDRTLKILKEAELELARSRKVTTMNYVCTIVFVVIAAIILIYFR